MSADRELLELAAKAVGGEFTPGTAKQRIGKTWDNWMWIGPLGISAPCFTGVIYPIYDGGDTLKLAVKLGIRFVYERNAPPELGVPRECAIAVTPSGKWFAEVGPDEIAVTRQAIVRAAAEIGREMMKGGAA